MKDRKKSHLRTGGHIDTKGKPVNEATDGIPVDVWNARRREQERLEREELDKIRKAAAEHEKMCRRTTK